MKNRQNREFGSAVKLVGYAMVFALLILIIVIAILIKDFNILEVIKDLSLF